MSAKLRKIRWVLATGFCFAFFFMGGLVISLTYFPIIYLIGRDKLINQHRCRIMVQRLFRFFIGMMTAFGLIRVTIENKQALQHAAGHLVIANHPTLIDVVVLYAYTPNANCVVKEALWHSPYLGWLMRATGFISNDNGEQLLTECKSALARGDAIVIFPEGSRTEPKQGLRLKRGVANIAVRAESKLLPVLISCEPLTLIKGQAWYNLPTQCCELHFSVQPVIDPAQLLHFYTEKPAAARELTQYLTVYFEEHLELFYERYYQPD